MKILVVDDHEAIRKVIKTVFLDSSLEVIEAIDGYDAIAKLIEHKPSLILMDAKMPLLDGVKTSRMIKKADSSVPIILMTGYMNTITNFEKEYFEAVLPKPFDLPSLRECVYDILREKKGISTESLLGS